MLVSAIVDGPTWILYGPALHENILFTLSSVDNINKLMLTAAVQLEMMIMCNPTGFWCHREEYGFPFDSF